MFSREEAKKVREEFWINFGKNYPRKWVLYDTKIKEVQLKFNFDSNVAQVSLDVSSGDEVIRAYYYEKMCMLKNILLTEYLPDAIFEEHYDLPEGKVISRIYTELKGVNIYRKTDWPKVQEFFNEQMQLLESFFLEYKDIIDS
ncbi:DUF4268 domain-containing protein [Antarcticibacterium arcticum]|uniref:DUF4268 domain-containing protein n=1 Tax=Antarcticibacterium arcticum TaxID=2585771 RepID=A0A5B8YIS4_9FLAO|nr:DUF4268 domain-containing protein [Antarcticibacterium arcticum]QED36737.1 DUF4268 domain-containing protein [Antarcticibacterium arcticum]